VSFSNSTTQNNDSNYNFRNTYNLGKPIIYNEMKQNDSQSSLTNSNSNYNNFENQENEKPYHNSYLYYQTNNIDYVNNNIDNIINTNKNDNLNNYYQSTISQNNTVSFSNSTTQSNGSNYCFRRSTYNLGKPIIYNESKQNDSQPSLVTNFNNNYSNFEDQNDERPQHSNTPDLEFYELLAKVDSHSPSCFYTKRVFSSLGRNFKMSEYSTNNSSSFLERDISDESEDELLYSHYHNINKQHTKDNSIKNYQSVTGSPVLKHQSPDLNIHNLYELFAKVDSHSPSYSTPRVYSSLGRNFKMSEYSTNNSSSLLERDISYESEDELLYNYYHSRNKQHTKNNSINNY